MFIELYVGFKFDQDGSPLVSVFECFLGFVSFFAGTLCLHAHRTEQFCTGAASISLVKWPLHAVAGCLKECTLTRVDRKMFWRVGSHTLDTH